MFKVHPDPDQECNINNKIIFRRFADWHSSGGQCIYQKELQKKREKENNKAIDLKEVHS